MKIRTSNRKIDLTGRKIKRFTVIGLSKNKGNGRAGLYWDCKCECGRIKSYRSDVLRKRCPESCGCKDGIKVRGKRFGKLEVIERVKEEARSTYWLCKCDCGGEIVLSTHCLKYGNHKSCGCQQNRFGQNHPCYKGHKEITGRFFTRAKRGAEVRNMKFLVDIKYLWKLFLEQDRKCALSGFPLQFGNNSKKPERKKETTASLDRIDSKKGYVKSNIQWIHKDINQMKMDLNQDYFIRLCKKVAENNKELK